MSRPYWLRELHYMQFPQKWGFLTQDKAASEESLKKQTRIALMSTLIEKTKEFGYCAWWTLWHYFHVWDYAASQDDAVSQVEAASQDDIAWPEVAASKLKATS